MQHYNELIDTTGRAYDIMEDLELRTKEVLNERMANYHNQLKIQAKLPDIPHKNIRERFDHKLMIKRLYRSWKNKCDMELLLKSRPTAEFEEAPFSISRKVIRKYL